MGPNRSDRFLIKLVAPLNLRHYVKKNINHQEMSDTASDRHEIHALNHIGRVSATSAKICIFVVEFSLLRISSIMNKEKLVYFHNITKMSPSVDTRTNRTLEHMADECFKGDVQLPCRSLALSLLCLLNTWKLGSICVFTPTQAGHPGTVRV